MSSSKDLFARSILFLLQLGILRELHLASSCKFFLLLEKLKPEESEAQYFSEDCVTGGTFLPQWVDLLCVKSSEMFPFLSIFSHNFKRL